MDRRLTAVEPPASAATYYKATSVEQRCSRSLVIYCALLVPELYIHTCWDGQTLTATTHKFIVQTNSVITARPTRCWQWSGTVRHRLVVGL